MHYTSKIAPAPGRARPALSAATAQCQSASVLSKSELRRIVAEILG